MTQSLCCLTPVPDIPATENAHPAEWIGAVVNGHVNQREAVVGMGLGESKTVHIPADQAYGQRDNRLIIRVSKSQLPPGMTVKLNDQLQMQGGDGRVMNVTVAEINADDLMLDGNHFLAGKDLTFDIELVEIV